MEGNVFVSEHFLFAVESEKVEQYVLERNSFFQKKHSSKIVIVFHIIVEVTPGLQPLQ